MSLHYTNKMGQNGHLHVSIKLISKVIKKVVFARRRIAAIGGMMVEYLLNNLNSYKANMR